MQLHNRFLTEKRDGFQALVCTILELRFPGDFKRIRQGTKKGGGDGGCDGFRPSTGTAYAVYAPRETTSNVLASKIEDDLKKAVALFGTDLKNWVFVHNDTDGLNSDAVITKLNELKNNHPTVNIGSHIAFNELWDIVSELTTDRIQTFLEPPPRPEDFQRRLPFDRLRPVIEYLSKSTPSSDQNFDPVSPAKLEFNKLGVHWSDYIKNGRRQVATVEDYFIRQSDPELADKIASRFRSRYAELREQQLPPDDICEQLYELAGGYHWNKEVEDRAAVASVLAYYFDRCDIFEPVPAAS
jgi:hypothetical protein